MSTQITIALHGIKTLEGANQYLREVYLPRNNQQFTLKPEIEDNTAYTPWIGSDLNEIFCYQEERVVQKDNTVSYNTIRLQIPKDDLRYHYVKTTVQIII